MSNPMPGWYPDPEAPQRQRFWDGMQWTEARAYPEGIVEAQPGQESQRTDVVEATESRNNWRWIAIIALLVVALLLVALFVFPGFLRSTPQPEPVPVPSPRPTAPTAPVTPTPTVGPTAPVSPTAPVTPTAPSAPVTPVP